MPISKDGGIKCCGQQPKTQNDHSRALKQFGKPTIEPALRCERWRTQLKLTIIAQEGISTDTLESVHETEVENSRTQYDRDRTFQNEQLKNAWLNKYQNIEAVVILRGDQSRKI